MIVAAVAAILAFVLQQPLLFVASGLALVGSVILILQKLQRRRANHKQMSASYGQKSSEDSELNALGILEIKPRDRAGQTGAAASKAEEASAQNSASQFRLDDTEHEPGEDVTNSSESISQSAAAETNGSRTRSGPNATLTIKEKSRTVRASIDEDSEGQYKDILAPYLQSLRASLEAQTVCLLKQSFETLHYHIEGVVSLNAYARSGGDFVTKVPLIQTRDSKSDVSVRRVLDDDFPAAGLGYYREPIAVKQLAVAAVPRPRAASSYFLLADSMQDGLLDRPRQRRLLSHFARLLGAILDEGDDINALDAYDYVRPRREIIVEEIDQARRKEMPLALALVHLNNSEAVADRGEREIKETESVLASQLRHAAREARVERFGELTYGVFFHAVAPVVEDWAVDLQRQLKKVSGPIGGGVSIGIAMLQDRHDDADAFRQDATDALREAFETGTCTIVE
jgi:GGDEF domain-containing protein